MTVLCPFFNSQRHGQKINVLKNGENVLKYIIENGIIDLPYVQEQMEMKKKKELLGDIRTCV